MLALATACASCPKPLSLNHVCLQDRVKGRVARALAVCHLGLGQLSQSLSYCGIAGALRVW
jgi:hypothetical protein